MAEEIIREKKVVYQKGGGEAVYGLGMIGAAVYYIMNATTFWMGAFGIVKAIFWPAIVVFELLEFLLK